MNAYVQREQKPPSEKDKTGIPERMKTKFERSSGFSFDDVRVHYNSEKPAQLKAHAYTQGNQIYVAPGQEKHLPHELGHVVQQKSNAVKPTGEIAGMPLNDDEAMESGADKLAEKAEASENPEESDEEPVQAKAKDGGVVQRVDLTSEGSYNFNAGFMSSIIGGAGVLGGIGSAIAGIIGYNHASKEKYVGQIEEYTDKADDACDDAEASYYEMLRYNDENNNAKTTRKAIETKKLATKALQLAQIACHKYDVKSSMKRSSNAVFAKEKADNIILDAQAYINAADGFIANRGDVVRHRQVQQPPAGGNPPAGVQQLPVGGNPPAGVQQPPVGGNPPAGIQQPPAGGNPLAGVQQLPEQELHEVQQAEEPEVQSEEEQEATPAPVEGELEEEPDHLQEAELDDHERHEGD